MEAYKLGEMEQRFADMIWERAPIRSGELAKLCLEAFGWKRTTTYTMLKRLCERKLFINEKGLVSVLMAKEEFQAAQGEQFVNETFGGSLPQFLAAFSRRKKLSLTEIQELKKLIDDYEEDEDNA
ncbi:MAG: BlaI/MecI/CopY family transcriptional regulator [Eubacterium sp.]|nr:BlaI/MecI/CopY family transcriptional regulator [Eubacterium sp.]